MARNPTYDGRNVLLPDVSRLRAGDIILSLNAESTDHKGGKVAGVITAATGGRFSHALICSEPPTLIEAIGPGVSTLSLARCFAHSFGNVRVLRYPDAAVARRAAQLAQLEVGRDYSNLLAAQSVFPHQTLERINDPGIFCSALVAQVYVDAGAQIFTRTPVDKTTPATLERMEGLSDVTRDIFREALAPNNIETLTALDGDIAPTISARQTEISNRYGKATAPSAKRIAAQYYAGRLSVTPTLYGMIDFIICAFDELPNVEPGLRADAFAELEKLDGELANLVCSGESGTLLDEVEQVDGAGLRQALQSSFDADPDIDAHAMRGSLITTTSQLEIRRAALRNMADWNQGRSRSASAYLELEARAIAFLEQREALFREILERIG
jgi:hypothetical protein